MPHKIIDEKKSRRCILFKILRDTRNKRLICISPVKLVAEKG